MALVPLISACTAPKPVFQQHTYSELNYPASSRGDIIGAKWLEEYHEPSLGERIFLNINSTSRGQTVWSSKVEFIKTPKGRTAAMIISGFPYLDAAARANIEDIAILPGHSDGGIAFETSMGEITDVGIGLLKGSAAGLGITGQMFSGANCSGDGAALCGIFFVGVAVASTVVGAVTGSIAAAKAKEEEEARLEFVAAVRENIGDLKPSAELLDQIKSEIRQYGFNGRLLLPSTAEKLSGPVTLNFPVPPTGKAAEGARKLVELVKMMSANDAGTTGLSIGLDRLGLYPIKEDRGLVYSFVAVAQMQMVVPAGTIDGDVTSDQLILRYSAGTANQTTSFAGMTRRFVVVLPPHSMADWTKDEAALFGRELETGKTLLAERITDYTLRLYRGTENTDEITIADAHKIGTPYRLTAIEPRAKMASVGRYLNPTAVFTGVSMQSDAIRHDNNCVPAEVGSLSPTFSWTAKPGRIGASSSDLDDKHFNYDLRVFDDGLRLVHRANNLTQPEYKMPINLKAKRHYYWTVRARFESSNLERVTDWAVCGEPLVPYPHIDDQSITEFYPIHTPRE